MDTAGAMTASKIAKTRVATAEYRQHELHDSGESWQHYEFLIDFTILEEAPFRSKPRFGFHRSKTKQKVTESKFVFVALDEKGNTPTISTTQEELSLYS